MLIIFPSTFLILSLFLYYPWAKRKKKRKHFHLLNAALCTRQIIFTMNFCPIQSGRTLIPQNYSFLYYILFFLVLKTCVWSTLTYGCECWTITSDIEKKIEAAEMWFIRQMLRISWTEKKPNVNVLREGNVQRSLLKTIRKRQMEFLGHVCRCRVLEFLSLTGKVEGKCNTGKQRITFLDSLCNSATGGQSKGLNFLKLSDDRDVWRGMAANVCSRSVT